MKKRVLLGILMALLAIGTVTMFAGCGSSSSNRSGSYGIGDDDDNGFLDYDDPEAFDIYRDAWDDALD